MRVTTYIFFSILLALELTLPEASGKTESRSDYLREIASSKDAEEAFDNAFRHFFDDPDLNLKQRTLFAPQKEYVGLTKRYKKMRFDEAVEDLTRRHARQNGSYRVSIVTVNQDSSNRSIRVVFEIALRRNGNNILVSRILYFTYKFNNRLYYVQNVGGTFKELSDEELADEAANSAPSA